ncbi:hypothetical protein [Ktedonobacter racemifer]|uniref:Uncharacterized protein n=1 Tax=Ktedonobacter racemifer DSM 44963 TaxID=485913 RepID=D6TN02_KTERA|nr:hypothetical protein [Ktedonobacter racemifer]EFH87152.1 hypothetical protein Krac_8479 [Ktedonobacter racemifer DSM 44963]
MSAGVGHYSSYDITEEELAGVILQADGRLTPGSAAGYFGGFIDGEAYVYVFRIPCYDGVFDDEGNPLDKDDIVLLDQTKALLGGEFQTWIYIHLGREPGSQRLAVRFAYTCCQHWPCVVDSFETKGRIFSSQEIEQLYKEDGAFTGYGL